MKLRWMRIFQFSLTLWLLFLLAVGSTCVLPQETTSEFTVPWKSSAEADGLIKPGEYDDALRINLTRDNRVAYLYVKHDGEFLYVFIDVLSDTEYWYDSCWVAIDTLSDGGDAPKEDDYLFDNTHHIRLGDGPHQIPGSQWEELMGHRATPPDLTDEIEPFVNWRFVGSGQLGRSANSLTPHMIFEIRIPITGWGIEEANDGFGFCVAANSSGIEDSPSAKVVWPDESFDYYTTDFYPGGATLANPNIIAPPVGSFSPPSTWGVVTLGDAPPDEYEEGSSWLYILIVILVLVGIISVVLVRRKLK